MPHSAKLGRTLRAIAAPLLLSLALHGLLFLGLWCWPTQTRSPALTIESTRITLDTRALECRSSTLLPQDELPAELRGADGQTTFAPRILNTLPSPGRTEGQHALDGARSVSEGKPALADATGSDRGGSPPRGSGSANLFPVPASAASVVYVVDRSVSMGMDRKLDFARRELIASLRRLPPSVRFQVIDYNDCAKALVVDGRSELFPAEPAFIEKAVFLLQSLEAGGNTNHVAALRRALELHPDVLYFLTDADDLRPEEVAAVTLRNQGAVLHTIELTRRRHSRREGLLARLAHDNHGTYRCVSVGD